MLNSGLARPSRLLGTLVASACAFTLRSAGRALLRLCDPGRLRTDTKGLTPGDTCKVFGLAVGLAVPACLLSTPPLI